MKKETQQLNELVGLPQHILILDTETISIDKPYIYDLGYIIARLNKETTQYEIVESSHNIIEQIYDNVPLFTTAYYESKRLKYTNLMKGKTATKNKFGLIMQELKRKMQFYEIDTVSAYNSSFDKRALEFTTNFFKTQEIFIGKTWLDILAVANNFIHNRENYINVAVANKWFGESGIIQTNAENTYRFITNNFDFLEEHMGLQDVIIEMDILNYCIKNGFDNTKVYSGKFIKGKVKQTFKLEYNGKLYSFPYVKKIKRKNGTISLEN